MVQITQPDQSYEALEDMVGSLPSASCNCWACCNKCHAAVHRRHGFWLLPRPMTWKCVAAGVKYLARNFSVSNCETFQARRMQARSNARAGGIRAHVEWWVWQWAALVAVLENHQQP